MLIRGMFRPGGILEFPFLVAATMAGWFIPQAYLLIDDPALPESGFDATMGIAALSMVAILLGDRYSSRVSVADTQQFDEWRLLIGAALLSGIGAVAFAALSGTSAERAEGGGATGVVTIYFFFFTAQYFGLALAINLFLKKYSPLAMAIIVFDYVTMSGFILFGGRRGPLVEIVLITFCSLWFQRRILPPRVVFILCVVVGALFVNGAAQYRGLVSGINQNRMDGQAARLPTLDEVLQIDFLGHYASTDPRRTDEARNAIFYIAAALDTSRFRLGLDYWNALVFRYVPAQIVGRDVKEALTVSLPDLASEVYLYPRWVGTTYTGFSDAFLSFGPAGAAVFGFIAALFAKYWKQAVSGSIRSQYLYCVLITTGLHGITHSSAWFLVFLPQAYLFSWLVFRPVRRRSASPPDVFVARELR